MHAKDTKSELYRTLADTSKAFHVICHKGMLNALHEQGVHGHLWKLDDSLYDNTTSVIKYRGELYEPFDERHRISQGGHS